MNRYQQAIFAQDACNPSGLVRSLLTMIDEVKYEKAEKYCTRDLMEDPAISLMVEKLYSMIVMSYEYAYDRCREKCPELSETHQDRPGSTQG